MPKLSQPGSTYTDHHPDVRAALELIGRLPGTARIFASCLLITGARPQELLNLRYRDVDHRGMVFIRALKKGKSRVVLCPPILSLIPVTIDSPDSTIFRRYSYAKFYRALSPLLRPQAPRTSLHLPVSRLFRRAFARGNHALCASDVSVVMQSLGHKSQTSTLTYL